MMDLKDLNRLEGKTIERVFWEPWGVGAHDAKDITFFFSDGTSVDFYAGSYCIPEEPSIYVCMDDAC